MSELFYVGHTGPLKTINRKSGKIMFVPDSNLVLKLLRYCNDQISLSREERSFLLTTRGKVHSRWKKMHRWIPINPTLAIMELTKQSELSNFEKFLKYFNEFFDKIYSIRDYDPQWVYALYSITMKLLVSTHNTIAKTIETTYSLIPDVSRPSEMEIKERCESLLQWMWINQHHLTMVGGPILYLCIYAIAGSQDSRTTIKLHVAKRQGADPLAVAKNVAWDLMYWVLLEIEYHRSKYKNTIICTSDKQLANLLAQRINKGPRGQFANGTEVERVDVDGSFTPFRFKRLEDSKLEQELGYMVYSFLQSLAECSSDSIIFGQNKLDELAV